MRCAHPKCKRQPVFVRRVWSWFRPARDQVPAVYLVCEKHDEEFFAGSFDREASERVAQKLMARPVPKRVIESEPHVYV